MPGTFTVIKRLKFLFRNQNLIRLNLLYSSRLKYSEEEGYCNDSESDNHHSGDRNLEIRLNDSEGTHHQVHVRIGREIGTDGKYNDRKDDRRHKAYRCLQDQIARSIADGLTDSEISSLGI